MSRAGRFPFETADTRLSALVAAADGTTQNGADLVVLTGTRTGRSYRFEADLPTLFGPGARDKHVLIAGAHTMWVDRHPLVHLDGEVQRPAVMCLERGITSVQVLATCGSLTQRGTASGIRVHRRSADGRTTVLEPSFADHVQPGDAVFVRESLF